MISQEAPQAKEEDMPVRLSGKAVFAPLSEQRRQLGAASFLRTHIPLLFEGAQGFMLEDALLRQLLDSPIAPSGNRLWLVAGGPGTGKSELLEWLSLSMRLSDPLRYRSLLHIHTHEANPLQIAAKLKALLPEQERPRQEQRLRFEEALRKPRLVAKVLLLQALDQVTQSDEESYGFYYGLSNLLDEQLRRFLQALAHGATMETFELVSSTEWEAFCEGTALPVTFSYQAFHQALQAAWNAYLFSGLSLPTLMRSVSAALQEQGTMPILLIDDLVCSLHQFAPDILGALLLAEGAWDVVCGITPVNENRRVADFFDRLSASVGAQGYYRLAPLDETQCVNLAHAYLLEYRRLKGREGEGLSPFNREALVRLFRGLPDHRRTPRAFLHHLETALEQKSQDAFLAELSHLASHEYAVLTPDRRLARLAEVYGPLIQTPVKEIRLGDQPFFDWPPQEALLPIEPLLSQSGQRDEAHIALFDWIGHREETSTVALVSLRKGAARLLQDTIAPEVLAVPQSALHSFLRWKIAYKGISPPILLAGEWRKADVSGIPLNWGTSHLAYDLARYATSSGTERRQLAVYLRYAPPLAPFFQAARQYQLGMQQELEQQLAMALPQLALVLVLWSVLLGGQPPSREVAEMVRRFNLPACSQALLDRKATEWRAEWQQFFLDAFLLLPGALDEERLRRLCACTGREHVVNLLSVDTTTIGKAFRWRGRPFQVVLQTWQQWWGRQDSSNR